MHECLNVICLVSYLLRMMPLSSINFCISPFQPAHLGMTWQYVVQWYNGGNMEQENVIRVESKPRNLGSFGLIDVDVWTNSDSSTDLVTNFNPLAVYVSVTRGLSPILMAKVKVFARVNLSNGTVIAVEPFELFDKGNGGQYFGILVFF